MKGLKRVEKKLRRRKIILRLFLLLATLSAAMIFALKTSFFNIEYIQVIGNSKLAKEDIIATSKINKGENILRIKPSLSEKNLSKLPYIKESSIKRKFPRGVIIEVWERKEIFQTKSISTYILVDEEGYVLDQVENKDENLPLIKGLEINNISPGDNLFSSFKLEGAIEFITEGYELGILKRMAEVSMELFDDVNIILNDGIPVAFGALDNVKYKLRYLDEILQDIEKNKVQCKMIIMNKGNNPILVTGD